jgi:hypothetical protein
MVRSRYLALLAIAIAGSTAIVGRSSRVVTAQTQSMGQMMTTASYQIELAIDPAMTMLTPDQAQGATMGEMMAMPANDMMQPSSSPSSMASQNMTSSSSPMNAMNGQSMMGPGMMMMTTDNGQPVNHHLEVQINSRSSGEPQTDLSPQIAITNDATGQTRALGDVVAMYDIQLGPSDLHYGNNLYLQDGATYTITVTIGNETAQFSQIQVSNGMGLPSDSMSNMGNSMPSQPMAGH